MKAMKANMGGRCTGTSRMRRMVARVLAAAGLLAMSGPALGATVTWNVAGSGNWDLITGNWTGGSPTANLYVDGDAVIFSNAAGGTITLAANRAPTGGTTINATGGTYSFTGNSITAGALNKSNAGTAILNSNFTGSAITVDGGILALGAGSGDGINPSGGTITINSGGTLRYDAANRIQNGQRIVVNSGGTFNLNNQSDAIGAIAGAGSITLGNATITLDDMDGSNFSGVISGTGGLILRGNIAPAGVQTLSGNNTYTGNTTIDKGTLEITNTGKLYSAAYIATPIVTVGSGTTLKLAGWDYNAAGSLGQLDFGKARLIINGGTIEYTGNSNTDNGNTANNAAGRAFTIGASGATLTSSAPAGQKWVIGLDTRANYDLASNGGLLTLNGAGNGEIEKVVPGTGGVTKSGTGTWTFSAANSYSGSTTVNGGRLVVSNTLLNSSSFNVNGSGSTLEFGATNIFVAGHGVALANTRVITVDAGTLLFNANMNARIGNVTLNNGATWTSNRGFVNNFDALLGDVSTGAATVTVGGTGAATMNGTGGIRLAGVQNFNVANVTGDAASDLNVSMILGPNGNIGGTLGGINKLGAGTMTLSGANTYGGTTTVTAGILAQNGTYTGGGDFIVNSGGTLQGSGTANGDLIVNSGGTVAPGNSIESLGGFASFTFASGSTFAYEIDTTAAASVGADLLFGADNSTLTIGSGALLNLSDFSGTNTFLAVGTKFTLIAYDGLWNGGIFTGFADDSAFEFAGNFWRINYDDTSAGLNFFGDASGPNTRFVTITSIVPEPASLSLLMLGSLALLGRRTKVRRQMH